MDFNSAPGVPEKNPRVKYTIAIALFLLLCVLYFGWVNFWSPQAKRAIEEGQKVERAMRAVKTMEDALRNDTYGGKTPQETLSMFISALEKGDVDLASKYFDLETNPNKKDYLTRNEWTKILKDTIATHGIDSVIEVVQRAKPEKEVFGYEGDYKFVSKDPNTEKIDMYINMNLNTFSKVWKIESL